LESNEALLELRNVTVNYGRMTALRDVSYKVAAGQVVCLLGGNASGKSTSMKAIFGTVPLRSGQVWWEGRRVDGKTTVQRVKAGIAAVPEGRRLFQNMSVGENIQIGACNRRDGPAVRSDLEEVYEFFPALRDRRRQAAGTLSGGEQQMVAIGRALMSGPRLLCMDEPSMGLSPNLVSQSFGLIASIQDRGTAVFVIEQNARSALKVADHAYVLQHGEIVLEGRSAEVSEHPMMIQAYLGKRNDNG
jgi:branched-chain amino acid transport system ATP-binding protein